VEEGTTLLDGTLSASDPAEYLELPLRLIVGFHVD
jgi:hypothetical protein